MTTNLSVGIVTYKTNKDHLKKCLGHLSQAVDSAKKSGLINGFEVILISNSPSTDQLKEMFRKNDYYLPIRIIENTKNTGFATAQNQILETISSDVHLILNPDAFLDKDSILLAKSKVISSFTLTLLVTPMTLLRSLLV